MPGGGVTQSSTRIQSILSNWTGGDFLCNLLVVFYLTLRQRHLLIDSFTLNYLQTRNNSPTVWVVSHGFLTFLERLGLDTAASSCHKIIRRGKPLLSQSGNGDAP